MHSVRMGIGRGTSYRCQQMPVLSWRLSGIDWFRFLRLRDEISACSALMDRCFTRMPVDMEFRKTAGRDLKASLDHDLKNVRRDGLRVEVS